MNIRPSGPMQKINEQPLVAVSTPVSSKAPQILLPAAFQKSDQINSQTALASAPVRAQLALEIKDQDGFLNLSEGDLTVNANGKIEIKPEFILKQLSEIPAGDKVAFKPATFDADNRQYVISGKALDLLGFLNVGFEVRLGIEGDQLAFRVNNGIKRGVVYKVLSKQLEKLGLETQKDNGKLVLQPQYERSIDLKLGPDHQGRIDRVQASPEQLKFTISEDGLLTIQLQDLGLEISSQINAADSPANTATKNTPPLSQAKLHFDVALNDQLKPVVTIQDGMLSSAVETEQLKAFLEKQVPLMQEQLGNDLQLSLQHIKGKLDLRDGLQVQASAELQIDSQDTAAKASAALSTQINSDSKSVQAQGLDIRLASGQEVRAQSVTLVSTENQLNLKAERVQGQFQSDEINASSDGFDLDLQKNGQQIQAQIDGSISGKVNSSNIQAEATLSGRQEIKISPEAIEADLDQVNATGSYTAVKNTEPKAKSDQAPRDLKLNVQHLEVSGKANLAAMEIDAEVSNGSLQVQKTEAGLTINTDATVKAQVDGQRIQGQTKISSATVQSTAAGLEISAQHTSKGSFSNASGKISVAGDVQGRANIVAKDGQIAVQNREGRLQAEFKQQGQLTITGSGGDADFKINAEQNIDLRLADPDLKTVFDKNNNRIEAHSRKGEVSLSVNGDDVNLKTEGSQSDLKVAIKDNIRVAGKSGDVQLEISGAADDSTIAIQAKDVKANTRIRNSHGNLDIQAKTQGNVHLGIQGDAIGIHSTNGKAEASVKLTKPETGEQKIDVKANGHDFNVNIDGDALDISLSKANFDGNITPNPRLAVDVKSTQSRTVGVKLVPQGQNQELQIQSEAALAGRVSMQGKMDTEFSNTAGFKLTVNDGPEDTISAEVPALKLDGQVALKGFAGQVTGSGDFELNIQNQQGVKINYQGDLKGTGTGVDRVDGNYQFKGQTEVTLQDKDLAISHRGQVNAQAKDKITGANGSIRVNSQDHPLTLSIHDQNLSVSLQDAGYIQLDDPQDLKLGNDPKLSEYLQKIHSKAIKVGYKDLQISGNTVSLSLRTEGIKTQYGTIDTAATLSKTGPDYNVSEGKLSLAPSLDFYEMIQKGLSQKYNIDIQGTPSFENGEIKVKGEIRTKAGVVQLANFSIKATVKDNKLVFDFDKAQVLGVIGRGTVGGLVNRLLSKTDIDVFKHNNHTIALDLADIVKDLSLTQGVNFTDLKLVDNRFEVGFYFRQQDEQAAKVAKNGSSAEIQAFIKENPVNSLSGESVSTLFNGLVKHGDAEAAADLMLATAKAYLSGNAENKTEMARGLLWMSGSRPAHKADLKDDIALDVAQDLNPASSAGKAMIKALPQDFIRDLANNLDQTLSQGGGWNLITGQERTVANQLRALVGLPANRRPI